MSESNRDTIVAQIDLRTGRISTVNMTRVKKKKENVSVGKGKVSPHSNNNSSKSPENKSVGSDKYLSLDRLKKVVFERDFFNNYKDFSDDEKLDVFKSILFHIKLFGDSINETGIQDLNVLEYLVDLLLNGFVPVPTAVVDFMLNYIVEQDKK